jgi:hypothetical protein
MILADARRLLGASSSRSDEMLVDRLSRPDGMRQILGKLSVANMVRQCSYLRPMEYICKDKDEKLAIMKYTDRFRS